MAAPSDSSGMLFDFEGTCAGAVFTINDSGTMLMDSEGSPSGWIGSSSAGVTVSPKRTLLGIGA